MGRLRRRRAMIYLKLLSIVVVSFWPIDFLLRSTIETLNKLLPEFMISGFRTHCGNPEDDGGGDDDRAGEDVGTLVASGSHPAPILDLSQHVFDVMTLAEEHGVVGMLDLSVPPPGDARLDAAILQGCTKAVAVIDGVAGRPCGRSSALRTGAWPRGGHARRRPRAALKSGPLWCDRNRSTALELNLRQPEQIAHDRPLQPYLEPDSAEPRRHFRAHDHGS